MSAPRRFASPSILLMIAAAIVTALSVWQTLLLARDNEELRSVLRATPAEPGPARVDKTSADPAELTKAQTELEGARQRLRAAEEQAVKLAADLTIAPAEELKSLGRSEVLAAKGASVIDGLEKLRGARNPALGSRFSVDGKDMAEWLVNTEAIGDLEDDPTGIADVHAHALRESLGLDENVTRAVRDQMAAEFEQLRAQGLDRPHRPVESPDEWYAKRDQALLEAVARIEQKIPAPQRKPHAIAQIMNLGTSFRIRTQLAPDGDPGIELYYQVPGMEPVPF